MNQALEKTNKIMVVEDWVLKSLPRNTMITEPVHECSVSEIRDNMVKTASYRERKLVEQDTTLRQPIPYVLLEYREGETQLYLMMQRTPKQTEQRLHGLYYVGVGGHVEEGDTISGTAAKEIKEETGLSLRSLTMRGIIITDLTEVDQVHVGIFYHGFVRDMEINSDEKELHNHQWVDADTLIERYEQCECWTQIVINDYLGLI
jgi:predicted NUDIX family phosphoesterase